MMKQTAISIPDMQSAHCQIRVNNAVKEIQGAKIENVEAGKLTVSFTSESVKSEIIEAIEKAGYTVDKRNDQ